MMGTSAHGELKYIVDFEQTQFPLRTSSFSVKFIIQILRFVFNLKAFLSTVGLTKELGGLSLFLKAPLIGGLGLANLLQGGQSPCNIFSPSPFFVYCLGVFLGTLYLQKGCELFLIISLK